MSDEKITVDDLEIALMSLQREILKLKNILRLKENYSKINIDFLSMNFSKIMTFSMCLRKITEYLEND